MSGHTKGPWALNPIAAQVDAFATGVPLPVCALLWPTEERDEAETEANAKLIAAAPELLEALIAARDGANFPFSKPKLIAQVNAAIAKATE